MSERPSALMSPTQGQGRGPVAAGTAPSERSTPAMGMVVGCDEGGRRPSAAPNFVRMMPPKPVHLSLSTRLVLQCRSQVSAETHLPERERERESYDCGGHSTPGRGSAAQCVHGAGNQLCGHGTELGSPPALLPHDSQLANLTELRPARMVLGHLGVGSRSVITKRCRCLSRSDCLGGEGRLLRCAATPESTSCRPRVVWPPLGPPGAGPADRLEAVTGQDQLPVQRGCTRSCQGPRRLGRRRHGQHKDAVGTSTQPVQRV